MRIGLISDTHIPQRCRLLPKEVLDVFAGVDLILHAGDVGDLAVLDALSRVAPVMAVHGNDDSDDARRELPGQALVATCGVRILLWHSHHEDRAQELATRAGDEFAPKLAGIAARTRSAGASMAVFGHWHIPLVRRVDGVLLVNPGAVASGNEITRQLLRTVAVMAIREGSEPEVQHIDLSTPQQAYDPQIDWEAGFQATLKRFSASILTPDLVTRFSAVRDRLTAQDIEWLRMLILPLAHRYWEGTLPAISRGLICSVLASDELLPPEARERFARLLCEST